MMRARIFTLIAAVLLQCVLVQAQTSDSDSCSASDRATDLAGCLEDLMDAAQDTERFWFGAGFGDQCTGTSGVNSYDNNCYNLMNIFGFSIVTLFWPSGGFDPSLVDRYLEVTFTSSPGDYTGCDHYYEKTESLNVNAHGTSSETFRPWDIREVPEVSFTTSGDNMQYFLLIAGYDLNFQYSAYGNIDSSDLSLATEFRAWQGALHFRNYTNPYVFMVFEQSSRDLSLAQEWTNALEVTTEPMDIAAFAIANGLTGPVAMNWVSTTCDPFSVETVRTTYDVDNCVIFIESALGSDVHADRPFLPPEQQLSVFLHIEFQTPAIEFTFCCDQHEIGASSFALDPLRQDQGEAWVNAATVRTGDSVVTVELRLNQAQPTTAEDIQDRQFTLLMVDPDVPFETVGTNERPLAHWLVINIEDGLLANGDELLTYRGPMPPDAEPHTYYYLLYEQAGELTLTNTNDYTCGTSSPGRCLFEIDDFVTENSLTLVGANWMVAENNAYVNWAWSQVYDDEAERCGWPTDNQTDPCVSSAGKTDANIALGIILSTILVSANVMIRTQI